MIRALLLFVLLLIGISAWDHFEFDITVFCNLPDRENYKMLIEWYEADFFAGEEQLTQPMILNPRIGKFSFSMNGAMDGDEVFSSGYSPRAYIIHDCTSDRKEVKLRLTITTLCEIGTTCHYRIIRDLTNDWGIYEAEANALKHEMTPFPDFP
ncbi:unnamed protein product [Caenorhabditis sp. 36 PRJEB53466]|nr:unnamed protein product [Caenorhabditis sp. 36 PRJEB53466]